MVAILSTSYHALHLQISISSPINCILEHSSFLSSYHNHRVFLHQLPPCPFFQALFFIIMNLFKSLSSYLKKNKSSSSIYIFFWLLSSFSQNSWRNSLQCFPLLHSIHLASFQKIPLTLLLQTSSAIFYSWNKSVCSIFAGVHCYPFILISLTSMPSSSVAFFLCPSTLFSL